MNEAPLSISVEDVSKDFRLPGERRHTLKERVVNPRFDRDAKVFHALQNVSFEVHRGEFFGIVGRNGSGKSTMLKCLAGIYGVDEGRIRIGGRLSAFIELGVGFNPDLAARDNIILNGIMLGLTPKEAAARVDEVIAFAELEDHTELKLKNYSSGMQVRLAFSVLTQVDADVLLIDEVLAVGDAAFQAKCFDVFRQLREAGKTIVLVTHDMDAVARFCDRALLLEDGEVVQIGAPEVVGDRYLALNFDTRSGSAPVGQQDDTPDDAAPPVTAVRALTYDTDFEYVQHARSGDDVMVAVDLRATQDVDLPAVTVELLDERGNIVVSATAPEDPAMHVQVPLRAGSIVRATLWLRAYLAPGRLRVRTILTDPRTGHVLERSDDLGHLEITSVIPVLGITNLPLHLEVTRIEQIEGYERPPLLLASDRRQPAVTEFGLTSPPEPIP